MAASADRTGVTEIIHGVAVADRFRWLEDERSPATRAFIAEQNARTEAWLARLPEREPLRRRLAELLATGQLSTPVPKRGPDVWRYFYARREPGQQQAALRVRVGADGPERTLVDPNSFDPTGLTTLDWWYPSADGRLVAYGLSRGGDEQSTLYVVAVDTGEPLPDRIPRTRMTSLAWLPDGSGFFYTRLPAPGTVPDAELHYHRHVFLHRLGGVPQDDARVFGAGRNPQETPTVTLSADGRYLVVGAHLGWSRTELYLLDRERPDAGFRRLSPEAEAIYWVQIAHGRLWVLTNEGAPTYRVLVADLETPERAAWREVIPRAEHTLQAMRVVGETIATEYLVDASSAIRLFDLDGHPRGAVDLPPLGTVEVLRGEATGHELLFGFTSFTLPSRAYRHDLSTGRTTLFAASETPARTDSVEVRQVWYTSRDGTRVPMFLVHGPRIAARGENPALLTGYGGFNISRTPMFLPGSYAWIERGGVWALPNLRGGGEFGEAWHAAGKRERKQNVFDDMIAAAEWLIENGYTRPERLASRGRSNGGLLMGALITQRPELFRAVACEVPLLDMVRYHRFLVARLWIPEYGDPEVAQDFRWLYAYSPYHNLRPGPRYPAVLFTTAEGDTRVHPLHALKMAALMQAMLPADPERPVLLRVESEAGHGIGKPVGKLVAEEADVWAFLAHFAGLPITA